MKPCLVIDLDGTLLDVAKRHYLLYCMILSRWGISPKPFVDYWAARRAGNSNSELMLDSGLPKEGVSQAVRIWNAYIESRRFLSHDSLWPGVIEWLEKSAHDYSLALCTVRSRALCLKWQLDTLRIAGYFTIVEYVKHGPNQGVRKAQRIVERNLEPILWIGDTEDDIVAARVLGIPVVVMDYGQRSRDVLVCLMPELIAGSLWDIDLKVWI